jgi:hypothetical protein
MVNTQNKLSSMEENRNIYISWTNNDSKSRIEFLKITKLIFETISSENKYLKTINYNAVNKLICSFGFLELVELGYTSIQVLYESVYEVYD